MKSMIINSSEIVATLISMKIVPLSIVDPKSKLWKSI